MSLRGSHRIATETISSPFTAKTRVRVPLGAPEWRPDSKNRRRSIAPDAASNPVPYRSERRQHKAEDDHNEDDEFDEIAFAAADAQRLPAPQAL